MKKDYIKQGDCLELMMQLPRGSIDMILCDLPYGITKCKWDIQIPFDKLWEQYKRIIKPNGAIVLFGQEPFSSMLRLSNLEWYKYDWIWDKVKGTNFLNAHKQPLRYHEIISVFYGQQPTYNPQITQGHARKVTFKKRDNTEVYNKADKAVFYDSTERYPRSIQVFSADTQREPLHPTQKPVALCEYLIKTYTHPREVVLDNCMGSGTTCIAAYNTNRHYIGFELNKKYFDIADKRIKENKQAGIQVALFD